MMSPAMLQNFIYALIQVVHNFGAVSVVALAIYGVWRAHLGLPQRRAALFLAIAWATQVAGGTAFGATSLYFYGHLPDIHGIAVGALFVKIACAVIGFLTAAACFKVNSWCSRNPLTAWTASSVLGAVALSAAAFLRWFS